MSVNEQDADLDPGAWEKNLTKLTNKPSFLPFKKAFVPVCFVLLYFLNFYRTYRYGTYYYFYAKIQLYFT
jgi:hypothetical protein